MPKLLCFYLFFSAVLIVDLVNGLQGYQTDSISDSDPYYINFYLEPNSTKSKRGFAEFCNYTNDNTCEDVADSAPLFTKKKDGDSGKFLYSFVYPPHSKTHKQLIILIHYDPKYLSKEPGLLINNETTLLMEYQWTPDKISKSNVWHIIVPLSGSNPPSQDSYERRNQTTKVFAFALILINLVIAFCVFFGSLNPRCCLSLIFNIFGFGLLSLADKVHYLEIIIPFVIISAVNFKPNPFKRFILVPLVLIIWEVWYYKVYNQSGPSVISLLLSLVFIGASYLLTKDLKNRVAVISTAYLGSFFPFIVYYALFLRSLHSSFPYLLASRHVLGLIGVAFQAKMTRELNQLAKATEETTLDPKNQNDGLTNSLL